MNNFEKIKAMSIDELVELIINIRYSLLCDYCMGCDTEDDGTPIPCSDMIKQWLEQESEEE